MSNKIAAESLCSPQLLMFRSDSVRSCEGYQKNLKIFPFAASICLMMSWGLSLCCSWFLFRKKPGTKCLRYRDSLGSNDDAQQFLEELGDLAGINLEVSCDVLSEFWGFEMIEEGPEPWSYKIKEYPCKKRCWLLTATTLWFHFTLDMSEYCHLIF